METPDQFRFSSTPVDESKYEGGAYEIGRAALIESMFSAGSGRPAIDLGCGSGHFARRLTARGWSVLAVDTSAENVGRAACFAAAGRVGDAIGVLSELPTAHADLVLALELIEHMPGSLGKRLLAEIHRVLRTDGTLLLSTPNRHSPEGLGGYYWGEKIRRWGRWTAWDDTHVHVYTSTEIIRVLRESGFDVETVAGYWYEGWLPLVGRWRLPLRTSVRFPFNRLGFNLVLECRRS